MIIVFIILFTLIYLILITTLEVINLNRNKKSVAINLKEKDGKVIFRRLVKTADVLVESFRPGVMQKLGFEYQSCKEINNRLPTENDLPYLEV